MLFCSLLNVKAQGLKIIDFSVIPEITLNSVTSSNDSVTLKLSFKINNTSIAQTLHIDFGTTQFSSNILAVSGTFAGSEIIIEGKSYNVTNYQARVSVNLTTQQYDALHYISLYVSDNNGNNTDKLEFVK